MKKLLILIGVLVVGGVGYYAISPLFNNVEVDDAVPVAIDPVPVATTQNNEPRVVESGFEQLSPEDQAKMLDEMDKANEGETKVMEDDMPTLQEASISLAETEEETVTTPPPPPAPVVSQVIDTVGHPAEGTVRVINTAEGQVIRFEDFKTINGPRLNLYLSKDLEGNDFIDLGPIRGTEGNINYTVPEGVDLNEYKYVMHWCVPFGVLFNYADVSS